MDPTGMWAYLHAAQPLFIWIGATRTHVAPMSAHQRITPTPWNRKTLVLQGIHAKPAKRPGWLG